MKNKFRFLIISVISFVILMLFATNIHAYNIEYDAWRYDVDGDGKLDLLFRRYSTPTKLQLDEYHKESLFKKVGNGYKYEYNGKTYTSKWIYVEGSGIYKPSETEFATVGYTFHTNPLNRYLESKNGFGAMAPKVSTKSELRNIQDYFTDLEKYIVILNGANNGSTIYSYYGVTSAINKVDFGTGLNMSTIVPKDQMVYRYAIIDIAEVGNVYVEDRVIYNDDVSILRDKLGNKTICYISDIVISKAKYDIGGYEIATNLSEFLNQYKKYGYDKDNPDFYSESSFGKDAANKGTQSVLNLFDNIINLPQTSNKKVLVRHINLGTTQKLSAETFNKATRYCDDSNYNDKECAPYLRVTNPKDKSTNVVYASQQSGKYIRKYNNIKVEEAYVYDDIEIYYDIEKSALANKICIGYNVAVASNFTDATSNITTKIKNGVYTEGTTVKIDGLAEESESEYIVIDFYYTETPNTLKVNHLYVDKDNKVMPLATEEIVLREIDYALAGVAFDKQIPRVIVNTNSLTPSQIIQKTTTKYNRTEGQSLLVRTAYSLLNDADIECIGYVTYDNETSNESIVGFKVIPEKNWYNKDASWLGVVVPSHVKQINFYYYKKEKVEAQVPKKQISLTYNIDTCKDGETCSNDCYNGACKNNEGTSIYSIPAGMNVNVGVSGLYRAMASAITIEHVKPSENAHEFDLKLSYTCGKETATMNINDIAYSFGYYRVTDLALDVLNSGTVYDASEKWPNTTGTSLFNWSNDKQEFNLSPSLGIRLKGAENINNNPSEIKNWKNYIRIYASDNKNNYTSLGTDTLSLRGTYLTQKQLEMVDANNDNKILGCENFVGSESCNNQFCDIHYAKNKLSINESMFNALKEKYKDLEEEYRLSKYVLTTAKNRETDTKKDFQDAEKITNNLKLEKEALEAKIDKIQDNIDVYKDKIEGAGALLPSLDEKTSIEDSKNAKPNEINTKNIELSRLKELKKALEGDISDKVAYINEQKSYKEKIDACTDSSKCQVPELQVMYSKLKELEQDATSKKSEYEEAANIYEDNCCFIGICLDLTNDCIENKNKRNERETAYKEAQTAVTNQETAIDNKKTELKNIADSNITVAEGELGVPQNLINQYNAQIETLVSEIKKLTSEIEILEAKLEYIYYSEQLLSNIEPLSTLTSQYNSAHTTMLEKKAEYLLASFQYQIAKTALDLLEWPWKLAEAEINELQAQIDAYKSYYKTMQIYFKQYKAKYDEFQKLKDAINSKQTAKVADMLGIDVTIKAYNMLVKVNIDGTDYSLNNKNSMTTETKDKLSNILQKAPEIETPKMVFDENIYTSVGGKYVYNEPSNIASSKLNGIRTLAAEVKYNTKVLIGSKSSARLIEDNVYYSENISDSNKKAFTNAVFKPDYDGIITSTTRQVNVYTPIAVSTKLTSGNAIDQSTTNVSNSVQTIQLSTPFTITLENKTEDKDKAYGITDTKSFCSGYYIKFNYDVHKVYINGVLYNLGNRVKAGTWIGMIPRNTAGSTTIKATAYSDVKDATINIADEELSSYVVRAVANNATYNIRTETMKYIDLLQILNEKSSLKQTVENICTNTSTTGLANNKPSYIAERTYNVVLLNRLYDFRITDLKDLSWKTVFREPVNNTINSHTGIVYYSGINKWNINSSNNNTFLRRTASEIGSAPLRTLPLAPYKNTDLTYVKAPKLGYTFSYDLKVTGEYYDKSGNILTDKKVSIKTKFYYVSDDGKTFLQEGKNGIYLFYKNDKGQYIRIDETNGGNYNLKFVPNDGYRLLNGAETATLSKQELLLGNLRNITLTHEMATVSQLYNTQIAANNGLVITYYGEYKLPNSTIAVAVDENGRYDINKPLKNGYIGVVFDIQAVAGKDSKGSPISLSYSKDTNGNNTSQWDYEGFLGITKTGTDANVSLKLEGATWKLTEKQYDAIKGTVILYDIDEKAANDYE